MTSDNEGGTHLVTHPPPLRLGLPPAEDAELLLRAAEALAHVQGHQLRVIRAINRQPGADVVLPVDAVGVVLVVGSVGVGVVAVGVRLVIISHISDHFVVRVLVGVMVWVRVVKQFKERVKPGKVMSVFGKIDFFKIQIT